MDTIQFHRLYKGEAGDTIIQEYNIFGIAARKRNDSVMCPESNYQE